MDSDYDVIIFFQQTFILRRLVATIFADIIKIVTMLLKQSLKTQEKLEELEIMYQNGNYISIMYLNGIYICIS